MSYIEVAIIAFIILAMVFLIWRGGQKNPVPTGTLNSRLDQQDAQLKAVGVKVSEIEERIEDIEGQAAKVDDIKRLENRLKLHDRKMDEVARSITAIREDIAEGRAKRDATARQLDMIYEVIVKKGMRS